ncbi:helix-turn-helix domain-containing protein [Actinomadura scrupuli]|uniref:helix-turn-helix domain-containing protein n=1 Tax=Actinomadura scrupuli TaxID=559629 RepID=UPI003D980DDF
MTVNTGIVALAVTVGMPMFELSIACEIFGIDRSELADPWYELRMCAADPYATPTQNGFALHTPYDLDALATADTVVVPALPPDSVLSDDAIDPRLLQALNAAHARGARIVSLCTGAFVLAAAGLLDERRATTHWMYTDILSARHPLVRVDPAVLYVDEGDVLTSAGRSAGIDLCLHLIRTDLGAEIANHVARRMVVPAHRPGGQAQYIEAPVPRAGDDGLAPVLQWAVENMDQQLTVAQMADCAGLSSRTLVRRFHEATGTTPLRWLHAQRLARARHLLEATDLPIERVSRLCGMGSAGNLRHHFTRTVGVTPMEYRRTFHRPLTPAL